MFPEESISTSVTLSSEIPGGNLNKKDSALAVWVEIIAPAEINIENIIKKESLVRLVMFRYFFLNYAILNPIDVLEKMLTITKQNLNLFLK